MYIDMTTWLIMIVVWRHGTSILVHQSIGTINGRNEHEWLSPVFTFSASSCHLFAQSIFQSSILPDSISDSISFCSFSTCCSCIHSVPLRAVLFCCYLLLLLLFYLAVLSFVDLLLSYIVLLFVHFSFIFFCTYIFSLNLRTWRRRYIDIDLVDMAFLFLL